MTLQPDMRVYDIRVVHSIVDHVHLAEMLREKYGLSPDTYCELIHRGMNDIYKVVSGGKRRACRVWRTGWRSFADVAYETEFLTHLADAGIAVANVIPADDGEKFFAVQAPEGPRAVAMFEWAEGRKFGDNPSEKAAFDIGALFARMHAAGASFKPEEPRRTNSPKDYHDNLPFLRQLVADRPGDMDLYECVAEKLYDRMTAIKPGDLPFGPGHGDFHFNNVHIREDATPILLDFDNSGEDFLMQDICCYVWGNHYGKLDPVYADKFVEGYESVRPLTKGEKDHLDLFVMAKEFRLISGFAKNVNQIGHFPLRFRSLEWFAASIRTRAKALGLL
jgi:Ser/Thr protein kinase RdoA (MazF antagonist)